MEAHEAIKEAIAGETKAAVPLRSWATRLLIAAACAAGCLFTPTASAASLSNAPDKPGYTLSAGGEVHAILRLGDTIYIGGVFTAVNGQPRTNLAAISASDGSLTSWSPTTNGEVDALAGSGSTIYAGGVFTQVTGAVARNGAAAFDTAGAVLGWDPNPNVASVAALVVEGSHVYLGGNFASTNNGVVPTTNLARVDPISGTADASWQPNPDASVNGLVSDGTFIYPIGGFTTIGGQTRNGLAAVSIATGAADAAWDPSDPTSGGFINAIAISPDRSTIYVTGDFFATFGGGGVCPPQCSMGHADRSKAAGLETAGGGRTGNATAWDPNPDFEGDALAASSSSVFFGAAGGTNFTWTTSPVARNDVAALDPVTGQPQAWDPSANNDVFAVFAATDGSVYVGGSFTAFTQPPAAVGFGSFSLPPESASSPVVTGTPQPGEILTCNDGTWTGATPQTHSPQFLLDGQAVGTAGSSTYNVADSDVGHAVSCRMTAQNRVTSASADSAPVTIVAPPVASPSPPPAGPTDPPPPVLFKSVNVLPVSGTVKVKLPGAKQFVLIQQATNVPVGTIVDVTHGVVQLVSAKNASGGTQTGTFYGGLFKIVQLRGKPPITELVLVGGNFKVCKARAAGLALAARKQSKRVIRHLWGNATGAFRTKGRYASATVRGTKWLTADRCDGTLIRVVTGAVTVRDLVRHRSLVLRGKHRYLARAARRRR